MGERRWSSYGPENRKWERDLYGREVQVFCECGNQLRLIYQVICPCCRREYLLCLMVKTRERQK